MPVHIFVRKTPDAIRFDLSRFVFSTRSRTVLIPYVSHSSRHVHGPTERKHTPSPSRRFKDTPFVYTDFYYVTLIMMTARTTSIEQT